MSVLLDSPNFWAACFGMASFLPMSRQEMNVLGWDSCDVILVTGDAYVDHPSFGMAVIGRVLEAKGYRVGIIAQPDWRSVDAFMTLGKPNLFFGVTAGNMDSMINRYTADRKPRSDDAYTPNDEPGRRPDRAAIVYSQRCKEAWPEVPVIMGGIEASLRRLAHYDYWDDRVRRSVLLDATADLLIYGNAERAIVEVAAHLGNGRPLEHLPRLRGTARICKSLPADAVVVDESRPHDAEPVRICGGGNDADTLVLLPAFEDVARNRLRYAHASRVFHKETNPHNARTLIQPHGGLFVRVDPPALPLTTEELDWVFERPYQRVPHPSYGDATIPAWEMIRFSVNIMRGCFGGCTFCSITEHEGRIIQNRSQASILQELEQIRDKTPGFTGQISDLGGPTANMYRLHCKDPETESRCRRLSCVYPGICSNLNTDHSHTTALYRAARQVPGIKKIAIASGLRYDLAVRDPEYVEELVTHHVGGYLKIAPEHTESQVLSLMMKPDIGVYDEFQTMFERYSKAAGKKQYLIPYFISAHPGTRDEDMMNLALWLKKHRYRVDQVQNFYPSPMCLATTMYHTERNPLKRLRARDGLRIRTPRESSQRQLHKAFLRWHAPESAPLLREALKRMGRKDLIGYGNECLVTPDPADKPFVRHRRPSGDRHRYRPARTKHVR
jgi:uncharacterized radical SAM protein YgiQ